MNVIYKEKNLTTLFKTKVSKVTKVTVMMRVTTMMTVRKMMQARAAATVMMKRQVVKVNQNVLLIRAKKL